MAVLTPDPQILAFLHESGLVQGDAFTAEPLTGGVASDIWKVSAGAKTFVVKKALSRLRVAQDWTVPVSRNASEVEWLIEAGKVVPAAVPAIIAHDPGRGAFAMAFLDPATHPVWKSELWAGSADPAFAAALGRTLAAIHAATAGSAEVAARFDNDAIFQSIRLEPYLEAAAQRHPDLGERLFALSRQTLARKIALVHGDVSPKNILVGPRGPVILDAECAWYGDPAFDLAFCLNHLLLKGLWVRPAAAALLACFRALAEAYRGGVTWEAPAGLEARVAKLLPALLLARVDGKSPVEYLTEEDRVRVRRVARELMTAAPPRLADIEERWAQETLS